MIDIAIIGAGPAGLSAGINAVQRNKTVIILGKNINTSYLYKAEHVDNYLGMPHQTGKEMIENFYNHAIEKGVGFKECKVVQIFKINDYFTMNVEDEFVEAKTVIISTGLNKNKTIPGEEKFIGAGVSYCATCDGMLYRGKTTVLIADNNEGEADANYLSEICGKVYFLPKYKNIGKLNENIEIIQGVSKEVLGEEKVTGIQIGDKEIACDGVFFIKSTIPINSMIDNLELTDGAIKVNRNMETNIEGVYAAGDCTGKPYQVSKAIGEGLIAAQQASAKLEKA